MKKQKTPLCLAIEYIESKEYNYLDGKLLNFANDIKNYLESLKPTEREMFEKTFLKGCSSEREFKPRKKCLEDYMSNLTQD